MHHILTYQLPLVYCSLTEHPGKDDTVYSHPTHRYTHIYSSQAFTQVHCYLILSCPIDSFSLSIVLVLAHSCHSCFLFIPILSFICCSFHSLSFSSILKSHHAIPASIHGTVVSLCSSPSVSISSSSLSCHAFPDTFHCFQSPHPQP